MVREEERKIRAIKTTKIMLTMRKIRKTVKLKKIRAIQKLKETRSSKIRRITMIKMEKRKIMTNRKKIRPKFSQKIHHHQYPPIHQLPEQQPHLKTDLNYSKGFRNKK